MVYIYHDISQIFDKGRIGTATPIIGGECDGRQFLLLFVCSFLSLLQEDASYAFYCVTILWTTDGRYDFFFGHFCYDAIEVKKNVELIHFFSLLFLVGCEITLLQRDVTKLSGK